MLHTCTCATTLSGVVEVSRGLSLGASATGGVSADAGLSGGQSSCLAACPCAAGWGWASTVELGSAEGRGAWRPSCPRWPVQDDAKRNFLGCFFECLAMMRCQVRVREGQEPGGCQGSSKSSAAAVGPVKGSGRLFLRMFWVLAGRALP